ncbi:MAG: nucleotidyltransferase domain-containing protein, partial [Calditrichaeota bacterium]|nr:nucleotidyltransferase domain-containing protein [Calditrichota bacterium]
MTETDTRTRADIEPILREVVDILVREYQPELIILYGSYAYGNPTRHSDIDLFIVKETTKNRFERNVEAARIVFSPHRNLPVQPLVFTPKELFERKRIGDYFI